MRIEAEVFKSFFNVAVTDIITHVRDLINSLQRPVEAILMVGGFSESPILQRAVKDAFQREVDVITPVDTSLCIMKGAVLFGHQPSKITERISRFTYGVAMTVPFVKGQHPERKKIKIEMQEMCDDVFDKHVQVGQTVVTGETQITRTYFPSSEKDQGYSIVLYKSTNPDPMFVDEPGCEFVGLYFVERDSDRRNDSIDVRLIFGSSDIVVETTKCDGSVHKMEFRMD
ncbi:heat shock 70 kDa protein 12A-like [Ruditapes philippinarum]|uniref:heat shock 70 kDa protein 12A-like n=1 Tax=Ruditapes philippinarum TaxID=129788 RepID=UPI00295ADCD4|nr:heat shock 70 kDa protein 12A-like [Ruditapes philippinarum]